MASLQIQGYSEITRLRHGGFATVYRAVDLASGSVVAIKVLDRLEDGQQVRFERELQSYAALHGHPNIVSVLDSGRTSDDSPYMVLEYMPGASLHELVATEPLNGSDAAWVADQVLAALQTAHSMGILHRDIKPANILLGAGALKLADFGLAKFANTANTTVTAVASTVAYAAPERLLERPASEASDLYSLGATLFRLVTGRPPYAEPGAAVTAASGARPGPDLTPVPSEVRQAVGHMLQLDPANRPRSAQEARAEIAAAVPRSPSPRLMAAVNAQDTGMIPASGAAGPDDFTYVRPPVQPEPVDEEEEDHKEPRTILKHVALLALVTGILVLFFGPARDALMGDDGSTTLGDDAAGSGDGGGIGGAGGGSGGGGGSECPDGTDDCGDGCADGTDDCGGGTTDPDGPDFVISFPSAQCMAKADSVSVLAQILNEGPGAWDSTVLYRIDNGAELSDAAGLSIGSGAPFLLYTDDASWNATHVLTLTADPDNGIPESNEDNNTIQVVVTLPNQPPADDSSVVVPCALQ